MTRGFPSLRNKFFVKFPVDQFFFGNFFSFYFFVYGSLIDRKQVIRDKIFRIKLTSFFLSFRFQKLKFPTKLRKPNPVFGTSLGWKLKNDSFEENFAQKLNLVRVFWGSEKCACFSPFTSWGRECGQDCGPGGGVRGLWKLCEECLVFCTVGMVWILCQTYILRVYTSSSEHLWKIAGVFARLN